MVSTGVQMKLNLLKTAVPAIFPETVEYKKKTLSSPEKFRPPKSRRKLNGAYEKSYRKRTLDELLEKHDSQQAEAASEERHLIEEQLRMEELLQQGRKHESHTPLNYQICLYFQHASSDHMSRGYQTTDMKKKQLCSLGKKKVCEIISQWTQSISNYLCYCAASSCGDGDAVEQKWMSIVNHVTNKHEGHGENFPYCLHGPIERNWIKAGSKAHKELELRCWLA